MLWNVGPVWPLFLSIKHKVLMQFFQTPYGIERIDQKKKKAEKTRKKTLLQIIFS
jgi:hypothetical protein